MRIIKRLKKPKPKNSKLVEPEDSPMYLHDTLYGGYRIRSTPPPERMFSRGDTVRVTQITSIGFAAGEADLDRYRRHIGDVSRIHGVSGIGNCPYLVLFEGDAYMYAFAESELERVVEEGGGTENAESGN